MIVLRGSTSVTGPIIALLLKRLMAKASSRGHRRRQTCAADIFERGESRETIKM
jgi:hypothetical protein